MDRNEFKKKVLEAAKELEAKSYNSIQEETAWKWAARAASSYESVKSAFTADRKVELYLLAQEYEHEAVEHAALVDSNTILEEVRNTLNPYQHDAWGELMVSSI